MPPDDDLFAEAARLRGGGGGDADLFAEAKATTAAATSPTGLTPGLYAPEIPRVTAGGGPPTDDELVEWNARLRLNEDPDYFVNLDRKIKDEQAKYLSDAQRLYDESRAGGGHVGRTMRRPATLGEAEMAFDLQEKVERHLIRNNPNALRVAGIVSSAVAGATANLYDPATVHADFDTARAVQRARAEASKAGKVLEGVTGGAGAALTLGRVPVPAQIPAGLAYGAVSNPDDPVMGAVTMGGLMAAGRMGRAAIGPKVAPATDATFAQRARYALHGGASEAAGGAVFDVARGAPIEEIASGAALNLGLGMQGARRPKDGPPLPAPQDAPRAAQEAPAVEAAPEAPPIGPRPSEPVPGEAVREAGEKPAAAEKPARSAEEAGLAPQEPAPAAPTEAQRAAADTIHGKAGGMVEDLLSGSAVLTRSEQRFVQEAWRHLSRRFGSMGSAGEVYEAPLPGAGADNLRRMFDYINRVHEQRVRRGVMPESEADTIRPTEPGRAGMETPAPRPALPAPTEAPVRPAEVGVQGGKTPSATPLPRLESDAPHESLREAVRAEGGLKYGNEEGWRGELDRLSNKETGTTGLVFKNGKGKTVEEMMQALRDRGAIPREMEAREFMDALEQEGVRRAAQPTEAQYAKEGAERLLEEAPTEARPAPEATSIKNRVVTWERAERGLGEIEKPLREAHKGLVDDALLATAADPEAGYRLVEQLNARPRPHTAREAALLDVHRVDLHAKRAKAEREAVEAAKAGDLDALANAKMEIDAAREAFDALDAAATSSGTEVGRALNFRRRMMAMDFSLTAIERRVNVAQDGAPLSEAQAAEAKRLSEAWDALAKEKASRSEMESEIAALKAAARVLEASAKERQQTLPAITEPSYGSKNTVVTRAAYEAAKAAFRSTTLSANPFLDPAKLKALAQMGAFHIEAGARSFGAWAKAMIADVGDEVKPHLKALWQEARKVSGEADRSVRTSLQKASAEGRDIGPMVGKIAESVVRYEGVADRTALLDRVHAIVSEVVPGISRRETMDAISGYGRYRTLDPDAAKAQLRALKGEMREVAKLEDMAAGQAPRATGYERQAPSNEQRRLTREVNEAKKKGGYDNPDPARALKTALATAKTRLRNEIADLQRQIDAKRKDVNERRKGPSDVEVDALREQRDALRERFDAVFGKARMTDAQRLAALKGRLEKSIAGLERQIETGDFTRKPKREPVERDDAAVRLEAREQELKEQAAVLELRAKLANRTRGQKVRGFLAETLRVPRSLLATLDMSPVGRQGLRISAGHPLLALRALGKGTRAMFSEKFARDLDAETRMDPKYAESKKAGVDYTERGGLDLKRMEEEQMSRVAERIPVLGPLIVQPGNRFSVAYLNSMRLWSYKQMTHGKSPQEAQTAARIINAFTGRGNVKPQHREKMATLAMGLWSPRQLLANIQSLTAQPAWKATKEGRKMVARQYAQTALGLATMYGLARALGFELEFNWFNSNFGKAREGDTRLDPAGGMAQVVRIGAKTGQAVYEGVRNLATGEDDRTKEGDGWWEAATRFLRTKSAPVPGAFYNVAEGSSLTGEKTTAGTLARDLLVPMIVPDVVEAIEEHGVPKGVAMGIAAWFGMGLDTYADKQPKGRKTSGRPFSGR